jgi:exoribonuclease R
VTTRRVCAPRIDFTALRRELELPTEFPLAAQREAEQSAAEPDRADGADRATLGPRADHTDIPFVTIDPATSRDLDQAVFLARRDGGGFRVRYAIADVVAFVAPGGPLEAETWKRGQTIYLPDGKVPLHPAVLSEGAASLLPDEVRPAVVWTIDLDPAGDTTAVRVERATVRSRAKLSYDGVQADVDAGRLHDSIALLPAVGKVLVDRGLARGAVNLPMPEQEIEPENGGWRLTLRAPVPVEEWNAQISLLTGMAAARIMLDGGAGGSVGLLRTMPPAPPEAVERLKLAASALGIAWPADASPGVVIAGVDPAEPRAAAFLDQAAELMRGAGYTAFDGAPPEQPLHAAVAAPYAHVTAPLRRLADRYATEACLALYGGREVPPWVRAALPGLPDVMSTTDRLAGAAARGAVDLTEAMILADCIGEEFEAAVVDVDGNAHKGGAVALTDPPVRARCEGDALPLGERIRVRLTVADPEKRKVLFEAV